MQVEPMTLMMMFWELHTKSPPDVMRTLFSRSTLIRRMCSFFRWVNLIFCSADSFRKFACSSPLRSRRSPLPMPKQPLVTQATTEVTVSASLSAATLMLTSLQEQLMLTSLTVRNCDSSCSGDTPSESSAVPRVLWLPGLPEPSSGRGGSSLPGAGSGGGENLHSGPATEGSYQATRSVPQMPCKALPSSSIFAPAASADSANSMRATVPTGAMLTPVTLP
mmetsp:Transcript_92033/g.274668  ORF Transcript_92033/g.274668 Transcript_92033/m.274668 type:complete len:221 (+) Transcript_92033:177-839(+)